MYKDSIGQEVVIGDTVFCQPKWSGSQIVCGQITAFTKNGNPRIHYDYEWEQSDGTINRSGAHYVALKGFVRVPSGSTRNYERHPRERQ